MKRPIFIIGAPRSGTSLLREILNRHPRIGICDETLYFYYVFNRQRAFGDIREPKNRSRLIEKYLNIRRIRKLDLDQDELSKFLMEKGGDYASFFLMLLCFYAQSNGKARCGEKNPQHAFYATTLIELFPNCRLIHIVRDPRAVVASLLHMPWASRSEISNARDWVTFTTRAHRASQQFNYCLIQYENLIAQPEEELKRICNFIGEDFTDEMLKSKGDVDSQYETKEWWFQRAKEELTEERIEIWRKELSPHQIGLIEWVAQPAMEKFGYMLESRELSFSIKAKAVAYDVITGLYRKFRQWGRVWYFWFQPTQIVKEEAWIDAQAF